MSNGNNRLKSELWNTETINYQQLLVPCNIHVVTKSFIHHTSVYVTVHHKPPVKSALVNLILLQIQIEHIFSFELTIVSISYDTQKWSYDSSKYDMSEYVKLRKRALKFSFLHISSITTSRKC